MHLMVGCNSCVCVSIAVAGVFRCATASSHPMVKCLLRYIIQQHFSRLFSTSNKFSFMAPGKRRGWRRRRWLRNKYNNNMWSDDTMNKAILDAGAWLGPKYVQMYPTQVHIEFIDGDGVQLTDICFGKRGKYPCRPPNKLDLFFIAFFCLDSTYTSISFFNPWSKRQIDVEASTAPASLPLPPRKSKKKIRMHYY